MSDIAVESTPELKSGKSLPTSSETPKVFLSSEKPKNLIIFDTETNGVPKKSGIHKGFVDFNDPEFTVRLLQLSWLVLDPTYKILKHESFYIKSDAKNTEVCLGINHITDSTRAEKGLPFKEVYQKFTEDLKTCKTIICHGTDFDVPIVLHECYINDLDYTIFSDKYQYNTKYLKKSWRLTLSESVQNFNEKDFPFLEGLEKHDALYDCCLTLQLIKERGAKIW